MKKIFVLSALCCMYVHLSAQNLSWVKQIGGAFIDRALAVTTDAAGNVYATGQFRGLVDMDPGPDSTIYNANGSGEAFLLKLDPSGNVTKTFHYGNTTGGHTVAGCNLAIDGTGNIVTAGYFEGSNVDFDPDLVATFKLNSISSNNNVFVQKLDPEGRFLWAVRWAYGFEAGSNNMAETGPAMALDNAGNVFTVGRFTGTKDFDPGTGVFNLAGGAYDGYVSKLNTNGEFQWAKQFAIDTLAGSYVWPKSVSVDGANNLYVAGLFKGAVDFNPDAAAANTLTSQTQVGFLVKLSATGEFLWVKTFGSNNRPLFNYHAANAVIADAAGNAYVTGSFMDTLNLGNIRLISNGNSDIFVAKLNPSGNAVWAKHIGTFYDTEEGTSIRLDANGDVYTTGIFRGSPDFNPGPGAAILSTNGAADVFVLKLSAAGDFVWARNYGGPAGNERIQDIAIAGDAVYTVGRFQDVVNFDPNGYLYMTPNKSDIFIHKINQGAVGVDELANDFGVVVYPNPATDQFTIQLSDIALVKSTLTVLDLQGRTVLRRLLTESETEVSVANFPPGIYLLKMEKGARQSVQKLVVQ